MIHPPPGPSNNGTHGHHPHDPQPAQPEDDQRIHPLWLRLTHWLNALAVAILVASGWRIYNAAPFFDFSFPGPITLGGWLGGALQWHFAAMWLLVFNGLVYLLLNIASGRWARKFFPVSVQGVRQDLLAALKGRLSHADPARYNHVQKLAYLFVVLDLVVIVLSGLVLWKSVQFPCCASCWAAMNPHGACTSSACPRWWPSWSCTWQWSPWCPGPS